MPTTPLKKGENDLVSDALKMRLQIALVFVFLLAPCTVRAGEKSSKNGLVYPSSGEFDEAFYRKLCKKQYEQDSVAFCLDGYRRLAEYAKVRIKAKKKEKERIKERILALGYSAREFEERYGESGKPLFDRLAGIMKEKEKSVSSLMDLDAETEFLEQTEVSILRIRLLKRLVKRPVPKVTLENMLTMNGSAHNSISYRGQFHDTTDAEVYFAYNLFLNFGINALEFPGYRQRILSNPALAYKLLLIKAASGKDTAQALEAALDSTVRLAPADRDLVFGWDFLFNSSVEQIGVLAADYYERYWDYNERNPPPEGQAAGRMPSASFRKKCEPVLAAFEAYKKTDSGGYRTLKRVLSDRRGLTPGK